jgi:hypothetical protein
MGMGVNLSQAVSDAVYCDFVDGLRSVFVVQSNEYYIRKLRGKKYLRLVNEEIPEKPIVRFRIESVEEGYGGAQEDIYGQNVTGPHLKIMLLKRQKTK